MSSSQIQRILDAIFQRAGLDQRDGHPLYAYRTTTEELGSLRESLCTVLELTGELYGLEVRAAFCLFAAEWFRRHHADGPWKWDTILEDGLHLSGFPKEEVNRHVREVTLDGLRWWNLQVISTDTQRLFLTTLACQGGLPLKTLQKHGAPLRRFFRAVLRQHEHYRREPLSQVVEANGYLLPPTLDNDEVHELTCRLIEVICELRHISRDSEKEGIDRLQYLDNHVRNWRERIPLRLEDDVATELIYGLLNEQLERILSADIAVVTSLDLTSKCEPEIVRELMCGKQMSESALAEQLSRSTGDLPPRMTLYLESQGLRVAAASVARGFGGDTFRIQRMAGARLTGPGSAGTVRLAAVAGTNEIACGELPGGAALPDLPWTFSFDDPHQLLALGSYKTRRDTVLVAVPAEASWTAGHGSNVTALEVQIDGRTLLRATGEVEVCDEDGAVCRIRTRTEDEHSRVFGLHGRRSTLGPSGSEVWLGAPEIEERYTDQDLPAKLVDIKEIWWRPLRGGDWRPMSDECLGDVVMRVIRENEILFQTRVTVFPPAFKTSIRSRAKSSGSLLFHNLGDVNIHPGFQEGVKIEVHSGGGQQEIKVEISGNRPPTISLRFAFGRGRRAEVEAACPSTWIGIVDISNRPISLDFPLPLDRLDGLRLQFVAAQAKRTVLTERQHDRYLAILRPTKTEGAFELPLSFVRSQLSGMLAQSDHPDGSLDVHVVQPPTAQSLFRFAISRHAGQLQRQDVENVDCEHPKDVEVFVDDDTIQSLDIAPDAIELKIASLGHPEEPVPDAAFSRVGNARWRIDAQSCPPGLYLATAWINRTTCLRPLRLSLRMDGVAQLNIDQVAPEKQFDAALMLYDRADRRTAWDVFMRNLVQDPTHPGWRNVEQLLKASRVLPITTFETIAALTRNDEAIARIGFLKPDQDWLWVCMEQLPFLWSLTSIRSWVSAIARHLSYVHRVLREIGQSDDDIKSSISLVLQSFAEQAPIRWRGMACVVACLYATGVDIQAGVDFISRLMPGAVGELLKQRDQERTRLIVDHDRSDTRETWPNPILPISDDVREIIKSLVFRDGHRNQWAMLNAPTVAAAHAVYDIPYSPEMISMLQEIRGVDPAWFENANEIAMFLLAGRRLANAPNCFATEA